MLKNNALTLQSIQCARRSSGIPVLVVVAKVVCLLRLQTQGPCCVTRAWQAWRLFGATKPGLASFSRRAAPGWRAPPASTGAGHSSRRSTETWRCIPLVSGARFFVPDFERLDVADFGDRSICLSRWISIALRIKLCYAVFPCLCSCMIVCALLLT